jgi:hypothetical protein
MDEAALLDVEIFAQKKLPINNWPEKIFHDFVFDVDHFKQKLNQLRWVCILYFLLDRNHLFFNFSCHLFPTVLNVNGKIMFAFRQKLIDLIYWDVKDSVGISSDFGLLRGSAWSCLALKEIFYVLSLFAYERFKISHGLSQFNHRAWNVFAVFDRLTCVGKVLNFIFDFLRIVSVCFVTHFVNFISFISTKNDECRR